MNCHLLVGSVLAWLLVSCGPEAPSDIDEESATVEVPSSHAIVAVDPGYYMNQPAVDLILERRRDSDLTASLVNRGGEPVDVVLPGDGSMGGRRTPLIKWTVKLAGSEVEQRYLLGGCSFINGLRLDEVVTLRRGEAVSLDQYGIFGPSLPNEGVVDVSLSYENSPTLKWNGDPVGTHKSDAMSRLRASPPLKLESNVVRFEITAHDR